MTKPTKTEALDEAIIRWLDALFPTVARVAICIIFFWFGILKVFDLSPASPLAQSLVDATVGHASFHTLYVTLAILECAIGILFLFPRYTRATIPLLLVHMLIVCSPLVLIPHQAWSQPFVPTLEGQYIIKNVAIIALAIGIAAQLRPLSRNNR